MINVDADYTELEKPFLDQLANPTQGEILR